ncbi:MAG: hypothetical protein ACKVPY_16850 [Paracoccaceae bacterium]
MAEAFSLKDALFNAGTVGTLSSRFAAADPGFPRTAFEAEVLAAFPSLELKLRIAHIAAVLDRILPQDFDAAADLIERALPPPLDPGKSDDDFGSFIFAPLGEVVVTRGLEAHFDRSMRALLALTQRFSMEFAIRPFLNRWPDRTLAVLSDWADHPHYHVRRLVSEGTRPRLPWGIGVGLAPGRTLPLLDRLHADPTRYVTRSVANHLNDIAKNHPALAVAAVERWRAQGRQDAGELGWMAGHALRTLVKNGHIPALRLLGFTPGEGVRVLRLRLDSAAVPAGGVLGFEVDLVAEADTRAVVDYRIDFARPGGKRAVKVFRLAPCDLLAGHTLTLAKRRRLLADATTYTLCPGRHGLAIGVNGKVLAEAPFEVTR